MPATLESNGSAAVAAPAAPAAPKDEARAEFIATLAAANQRSLGEGVDVADAGEPTADDGAATSDADPPPVVDPKATPEPADTALADPTKTAAPTLPTPPAPTGPSREWIAFAMERNVPRELIAMARDDKQLEDFVLLAGDDEAADPEQAGAAAAASAASELKLLLGEDEFDATDPVHRQVKAIVDAHNSTIAELKTEIASLRSATTNLVKDRENQAQLSLGQEYDAHLDALGLPDLGPSMSPQRQAAYEMFDFFVKTNSRLTRAEAARRAVFGTFPDLVTKQATAAQLAALKGQQQETLGGGPARPPAKKEPTPKEIFRARLRDANRRALEREAGK